MSDIDPRLIEARALLEVKPAEAEELVDQLILEGVDLPNSKLCKGLAIGNGGDTRRAAEYLMESATSPEFYINAASYYAKLGDEQKEILALTQLLEFSRRDQETPFRRLAAWAVENEKWGLAQKALLAVFEQNSTDIGVLTNLAKACNELRLCQQAITFHLRVLELLPEDAKVHRANAHAALSGIYKDTGCQQKAKYHFVKTYEMSKTTNSSSNLIMDMQYTEGVSLQEFYDQCREFSTRFLRMMPRFQHPLKKLDANKSVSGLRIGFVSGDFVAHSLTNLMLEPFKQFKLLKPQHTLLCYFTRAEPDGWTEKYKSSVDIWRDVNELSNLDLAKLIHEDQVDVLIDLAGHTAYNALPAFGYKPAPVQMGWISGMMTPPAIETVNYFFTDPYIRPEGAKDICAEKLINLPSTCTYFPMADPPEVGGLPYDKNGYITFGSFNNPCKISDVVLMVWAACLQHVPNSRMQIKVYNKDHEREIIKKMLERGIDQSRLAFIYPLPGGDAVMRYITDNFDVALDTWPCAGMLTSAEIMWMGVPVMTLVGETFLHNQTHTLNCQCGIDGEFSAATQVEFVEKTKAFCAQKQHMRDVRSTLRDLMLKAPVRDPAAVAGALLEGCEWAWGDWCKSRHPLQRLQLYGDTGRAIM